MSLDPQELARIDWGKDNGLVPAIVQDARNASVLMLGYMNREALQRTLETGRVTFYSRSRQRLWEKGETSGNALALRALRLDCDGDTLLVSAVPAGPVCHTGTASCFGDAAPAAATALAAEAAAQATLDAGASAAADSLQFLAQLEGLISQRIAENPEGSYTARLYRSGMRRIAQKVGEEGLEVALAGCVEADDALLGESADLLYHLLVLLCARSLNFAQVVDLLRTRHESRTSTAGSRRL